MNPYVACDHPPSNSGPPGAYDYLCIYVLKWIPIILHLPPLLGGTQPYLANYFILFQLGWITECYHGTTFGSWNSLNQNLATSCFSMFFSGLMDQSGSPKLSIDAHIFGTSLPFHFSPSGSLMGISPMMWNQQLISGFWKDVSVGFYVLQVIEPWHFWWETTHVEIIQLHLESWIMAFVSRHWHVPVNNSTDEQEKGQIEHMSTLTKTQKTVVGVQLLCGQVLTNCKTLQSRKVL